MHSCPECGMTCHCGGDIDDLHWGEKWSCICQNTCGSYIHEDDDDYGYCWDDETEYTGPVLSDDFFDTPFPPDTETSLIYSASYPEGYTPDALTAARIREHYPDGTDDDLPF